MFSSYKLRECVSVYVCVRLENERMIYKNHILLNMLVESILAPCVYKKRGKTMAKQCDAKSARIYATKDIHTNFDSFSFYTCARIMKKFICLTNDVEL